MGSHQSLSSRSLAVLAVLQELLDEKSQETDRPEAQLTNADWKIASRLGYRSTSIVRTELGRLSEAGFISKYTGGLSEVIVTLLNSPSTIPRGEVMGNTSQGWYGQFEQPDYADIKDSVYVTLLELRLKAMERTGTPNPQIERAEHEIAKLRSFKIANVREALTRLAKEGKIIKHPSPDGTTIVQLATDGVEPDQADPEVEELFRKKDHLIKELNKLIEKLNKSLRAHEQSAEQHRFDLETQRSKLETANNRARKAHEELRDVKEQLERQLGALREELRQLRQGEARRQQELEALQERLDTAEAELKEWREADSAAAVDILPEGMGERFVDALQT